METGIGIPNPLFFVGVVENNDDPRLEGRVQIRAFGIHGTIEDIPSDDLPWATCIMGNHDPINVRVPPLNSWVFGFFIDGRDAQQPMVLGAIPTQMLEEIDPKRTGWGVALGGDLDVGAQGSREQDFGQPPGSRIARGEELERTYLLPLEANRMKNIEIAGGFANISSRGNMGVTGQDDTVESTAIINPSEPKATEKQLYEGLRSRGFTDIEARGIIANMIVESKLDPGINEISPLVAGSRGGFGLIQWTGSRRRSLEAEAIRRGVPVNDTNFQLDYLALEMRTSEKASRAAIAKARTPSEAARIFSSTNLRPGIPNTSERVSQALRLSSVDFGSGIFTPSEPRSIDSLSNAETISISTRGSSWEEPAAAYNAAYPHNRVLETPGGHVIEIDSTQRHERIMLWHPSGSYIQMAPATSTQKATGDMYSINEQNYHMSVGGSNIITIEGDSHVLVKGNKIEEIRGDYQQIIKGNHIVNVAGQMNFVGGENGQFRAGSLNLESNVEQLHIKTVKSIKLESESIHIKAENLFLEGSSDLNILGGADIKMESVGNTHLKSEVLIAQANSEMNLSSNTLKSETSGTTNIKSQETRIGSSSTISINASTVNIDDIVNLAGGGSSNPAGVTETAESAIESESAADVSAPAPTSRSISKTVS